MDFSVSCLGMCAVGRTWICVGQGGAGGSPVPYTPPSVDCISPYMAVHECLLPPGPRCSLLLFCEDIFFPSVQLFVFLLCHPSFSSIFLMPLYFTLSCACLVCVCAQTHTIIFYERFIFCYFFPPWVSVLLFSSETLTLISKIVSQSHPILSDQLQPSGREITRRQRP